MMHEATPLTADEYLKFIAITERATQPEARRAVSNVLMRVRGPQSYTVVDAWVRAASQIWRTAPEVMGVTPQT
jgi:hypothetical protein